MDEGDCPSPRSTALSPLPSSNSEWSVDPALKRRLSCAAAASGFPSPDVVPGAAALLLPLKLPLNTDRKRRAAAPYAIEPHLACKLEEVTVAVGPRLSDTHYLCAAAHSKDLTARLSQRDREGAVLPDLCAVPVPSETGAWALWCGQDMVYVRAADGGGCVIERDAFADIWRAYERPRIELFHGVAPTGVDVSRCFASIPPLDPSVFQLDLRQSARGSDRTRRSRIRFGAALSGVAVLLHALILLADSTVLARLAQTRGAALDTHLADRGLTLDRALSASVLQSQIVSATQRAPNHDPFLVALDRLARALTDAPEMTFRDLRYDASAGTITVLINARDLAALQNAEAAVRDAGIAVASGAATRSPSGAEMQLVISEAI